MPTAAEVLCGSGRGTGAWGAAASLLFSRPSSAPVTPNSHPIASRPAPAKAHRTPSAPGESAHSPNTNDGLASVAGALLDLSGSDPSRMSHKQVEQHRRLKAKEHFDELRCLVPGGRDAKNDRNRVLALALAHLK
ncbi:hypothetical protein T484DRAFT_1807314, partial [Baffinella frigidus]